MSVIKPSAITVAGPWRLACVALTAVYLTTLLLRSSSSYSVSLDAILYTACYAACSLCCAVRARRAGASAGIWRLFAVGIGMYAAGWAAVGFWLVDSPEPPMPSIADVAWISFYPAALVAIVRIMHRIRTDRTSTAMVLDSLIAGLGTAAVCAWVVLPRLSIAPGASSLATATAAAYPCADVLLIGAVTATIVAARFDVPRTIWMILGAIFVLTGADCIYVTGIAGGTFQWGTWVNALWLLAILAIAMRSGTPFAARTASRSPAWPVQAVPAMATLSSLAILLLHASGPHEHLVEGVCAVTIAVAVLRLSLSYHEAQALTDSRQLAHTDELTGLVNRRGFQERGAAALVAASGSLAVLLVDLDGFKDINDGLGHPTGDELLRSLGRRLVRESKGVTLVARIGGDEFAVITDDADGAATIVAERLLATIRRPFDLQGMELRVDASIGIASSPLHGTSLDDLLRHADIAMYRAKAAHQGVQRYSPDVEENRGTLRTIAQLRHALESDPVQLVLHYQPKIQLLSGRLAGVEALVRWQHPERGLLMPAEFLPLAEKARLMPLLTERVLERVLAQIGHWRGELRGLPVAVNLQAEAVTDPSLVDRIAAMLRSTGTQPHQLQLEITEDFLMTDFAGARKILDRLRVLGVKISIDDYGTGYSSLAYLRDLPVDELKLDRAFVQPILNDPRAAAIVRSTIDLAHSLGLVMVAEGIEDEGTSHLLLAMGCDIGQGYLYGRPQPQVALELALASATPAAVALDHSSLSWPMLPAEFLASAERTGSHRVTMSGQPASRA